MELFPLVQEVLIPVQFFDFQSTSSELRRENTSIITTHSTIQSAVSNTVDSPQNSLDFCETLSSQCLNIFYTAINFLSASWSWITSFIWREEVSSLQPMLTLQDQIEGFNRGEESFLNGKSGAQAGEALLEALRHLPPDAARSAKLAVLEQLSDTNQRISLDVNSHEATTRFEEEVKLNPYHQFATIKTRLSQWLTEQNTQTV